MFSPRFKSQQVNANGKQHGVVLVMALIFLLVLTLIGIGVTQSTSLEEKMAANSRDKDLSFQAAEAGLRIAQSGIRQDIYSNYDGTNGLYTYDPTQLPVWNTIDWTNASKLVNYSYTSSSGSTNPAPGTVQRPDFIIEQLPPVPAPGQNLGATEYGDTPTIQLFRITARGYGGDKQSQTVLQTVYQP